MPIICNQSPTCMQIMNLRLLSHSYWWLLSHSYRNSHCARTCTVRNVKLYFSFFKNRNRNLITNQLTPISFKVSIYKSQAVRNNSSWLPLNNFKCSRCRDQHGDCSSANGWLHRTVCVCTLTHTHACDCACACVFAVVQVMVFSHLPF